MREKYKDTVFKDYKYKDGEPANLLDIIDKEESGIEVPEADLDLAFDAGGSIYGELGIVVHSP